MSHAAALVGAAALIVAMSVPLRGQEVSIPVVSPELRADVLLGHQSAAQIGAGVQIPLGYYVQSAAWRRNVTGVFPVPTTVYWNIDKAAPT